MILSVICIYRKYLRVIMVKNYLLMIYINILINFNKVIYTLLLFIKIDIVTK